jgi:ankyrin repeat protein
MTTPDENGQLPLHAALQNNVTLGSIKLLVKGNPSAVQSPDNSGALPLHIACQHHESSLSVVEYLLDLDATTLHAEDRFGNTTLHYACHGAKYATIALLLDKLMMMPCRSRNKMLTNSFPSTFFGKAMEWTIEKALNTRRVSFGF